jgi:hypothetical protein
LLYICVICISSILLSINRGIHFEGLQKYDDYLQCDLVPIVNSCHCKVIQLIEKYIQSNLTLQFLKDYQDYMWFTNMWGNTDCSIYHITSNLHVLQGKNMNLTIPIWEPISWTLVDTGHPWVILILNSHSSRVIGWHPCIHPLSVVSHMWMWAPESCCTII